MKVRVYWNLLKYDKISFCLSIYFIILCDVTKITQISQVLFHWSFVDIIINQGEFIITWWYWMLTRRGPHFRRGKDQIQAKFKCIIEHSRNYTLQNQTGSFNAGICIYLNKPRFEIMVNHKIKTKHFENWLLWLLFTSHNMHWCLYGIQCYLFHVWHNISLKIIATFSKFGV